MAFRVVDGERSLSLRKVSTFGMDEARLFELTWEDRVIPVFASVDHASNGVDSPVMTHRIKFVGDVPQTFLKPASVRAFNFVNATEREQATAYAIEALTLFGYSYDGPVGPADRSRVIGPDGRLRTRADFGYDDTGASGH